jgi:hypothetical protein
MVDCAICRSTISDDKPTKTAHGAGVGFEVKECRQEGINNTITYIVSP